MPFFTLAVRRPVIEFWDVQPLVRILGFGRRHYVLESSCNYLRCSQEISNVQEICGLTKVDFSRRTRQRMRIALCCSTVHNTIRQRSVFPCRLQFPPSRETRSTLEQSSGLCGCKTKPNLIRSNKTRCKYRGPKARHARRRITCVFPSQCIARHTEELCEVQGNTSTRAPQALSLVETNEASSRELLCATHDLAPPFHRPCGPRHKGISIKNTNQAEQDVVAQSVS
jgi:hypothetical protein